MWNISIVTLVNSKCEIKINFWKKELKILHNFNSYYVSHSINVCTIYLIAKNHICNVNFYNITEVGKTDSWMSKPMTIKQLQNNKLIRNILNSLK